MKLGLSFSRCMRDLIEEKVMYDDVLVIIGRSDFDPHNDNHWNDIWYGYTQGGFSHPEWRGYEDRNDEFRRLAARFDEPSFDSHSGVREIFAHIVLDLLCPHPVRSLL